MKTKLEQGLPLGGGPHAWTNREGFAFFQAASEATIIRLGVQQVLRGSAARVAPTEGAER